MRNINTLLYPYYPCIVCRLSIKVDTALQIQSTEMLLLELLLEVLQDSRPWEYTKKYILFWNLMYKVIDTGILPFKMWYRSGHG